MIEELAIPHDGRVSRADLSAAELLAILVANRRVLLTWSLVAGILALAWILMTPRTYTAQTQLTPVSRQQSAGRLASLAAQFGMSGIIPEGSNSPEYLVDVATSREMLASLVDTEYSANFPSRWPLGIGQPEHREGTLIELYDLDVASKDSRDKAILNLKRDLSVKARPESGVVTVSVRMRSPELALAIATQMLSNLEHFNRDRRQSQASAERRFVEERLEVAKQELAAAESALAAFLSQNRTFEGSPWLRFEHDRLARDVALRHEIVRGLMQSNEQARIEEVRSAPVYTIVSAPAGSLMPDRRHGLLKLAGALCVGLTMGAFVTLISSLIRQERIENESFARQWAEIRASLASDLRPLRRLLARKSQ